MPRPKCCRKIGYGPVNNYFIPQGRDNSICSEVILTLDEFESVKLADFEKLYQAQAALKMGISRQTFGRIIESAHEKIADALLHGKALRIEGGEVSSAKANVARCEKCRKHNADDNKLKVSKVV
jgi:uncharacterized protein